MNIDYKNQILKTVAEFEQIAGLDCYYVPIEESLNSFQPPTGCDYCKMIQSTYDGLYKCSRQRQLALRETVETRKGKILRCHAGLIEIIIPLIIDSKIIGFFHTGFFGEKHAMLNLLDQKEYFGERYDINPAKLEELVSEVKIVSTPEIDNIMQLLTSIANLHFHSFSKENGQPDYKLRLPLPEDYYNQRMNNPLKPREHESYREMIAEARKTGGNNAVVLLRNEMARQQDFFCSCIASGRTVEAKEAFLVIMGPAYNEKDVERATYEVYKRISRITKRLHDYFGYNDSLDEGKYLIFQGLIKAKTHREIRLFSNDFYQLVINCFGYMTKTRTADLYEQTKAYVQSHCTADLKVSVIARELSVTPDHLNRVFKAKQNVSIKKYITLAQIDRIKELLITTDWSVEAIADTMHYESARSIYRVFTNNVGMTCNEYRKLFSKPDRAQLQQLE